MKKILALTLLSVTLAAPSLFAAALTLTLEGGGGGFGPYTSGSGGEFTFGISDPTLIASGYVSGAGGTKNQVTTPVANSFQTFCVETGETISHNGVYTATLNDHTVLTGTYLNKGTAYLYSQFVTEGKFGTTLGLYNYGANRTTTAGQLQNAIWAFMGQGGQTAANNALNPFFQAAVAAEGGTFALADATVAAGFLNVSILNLVDSSGINHQDQLIYTPGPGNNNVPDGGMTVMLLGMSLTGLGFISRRIRR